MLTAGPTLEYLDDVRFFANGSSGRMGYALTAAAVDAGHRVFLVTGPTALTPPEGAQVRSVTSALEMEAAVDQVLAAEQVDIVIAVAAVADYRPAARQAGKLASGKDEWTLRMVPNPDILAGLGRRRVEGTLAAVLVGFALQAGTADEALAKGQAKLEAKHLDMIVTNRTDAMGAAESEATLLFADGRAQPLPRQDKLELARAILREAEALLAAMEREPENHNEDGTPE